ncbi:hypothetical protein CMI47_11940 [Candidatus Pacearchaeota archaeon]|nr:hypothetical protein [Candidatus Pacearchaeota archaeon]|tara:strand:+ start:2625 stop:2879 length:255 start_codon:yes stop_codon:yes gene_type:complete
MRVNMYEESFNIMPNSPHSDVDVGEDLDASRLYDVHAWVGDEERHAIRTNVLGASVESSLKGLECNHGDELRGIGISEARGVVA